MSNRGLSSEEIAIVKAMLAAKMAAQDICGYMFRPNRSLNPAGVYEIKAGKRGQAVAAATSDELAKWLSNHPYFGTIATADLVSDLRKEIRGILRPKKVEGIVEVDPTETSRLEFKETFHLRSFPEYCRSLIGYANHRGGFIVFGIKDDRSVVGLGNASFKNLDPKKVSELLKDLVTPTVRWVNFTVNYFDKEIGVIFAEEAEVKPLITIKNSDKIKENTVYFRYEAETAVIRAGDLQGIIAQREKDAIQGAISKLQQISGIGWQSAEVVDSDPADIADGAQGVRTQYVDKVITRKSGISDMDILAEFIKSEGGVDPVAYMVQAAHEAVRWLPLFYYLSMSGLSQQAMLMQIQKAGGAKPATLKHMKDRLSGKISPFKSNIGSAPLGYLSQIAAGTIPDPKDRQSARHLAISLVALTEEMNITSHALRAVLAKIVDLFYKYSGDSAIGSSMRRSAARVDEVLFKVNSE